MFGNDVLTRKVCVMELLEVLDLLRMILNFANEVGKI